MIKNVLLVNPPFVDNLAISLPLGLVSLSSYLNGRGIPCEVVDLNAAVHKKHFCGEATESLLSSGFRHSVQRHFVQVYGEWFREDFQAKLDDPAYLKQLSPEHYNTALARHIGNDIALDHLRKNISNRSSILANMLSAEMDGIDLDRYDIIGIGVSNAFQLVSCGQIVSHLRQKKPDVKIAVGGSVFTINADDIAFLFDALGADVMFRFDGEVPFERYVRYVRGETAGELEDIPNLVFSAAEGFICNPVCAPIPIGEAMLDANPRFLNIEDHADSFFPVLVSRGCYWSRCKYCDFKRLYVGNYTVKQPEILVAEIERIKEMLGFERFILVADAISPAQLKRLAKHFINNDLGIKWTSYLKIDDKLEGDLIELLTKSGLLNVAIGIETPVERLLEIIDKNYNKSSVERVLRELKEREIRVKGNFILGLPSATDEDYDETFDFIHDHLDLFDDISFFEFKLSKHAEFYHRHFDFGIQPLSERDYQYGINFFRFKDEEGGGERAFALARRTALKIKAELIDRRARYTGLT